MNNEPKKPIVFKTEAEARAYVKKEKDDVYLMIIYSPHNMNKNGDYFVDENFGMVRRWETVVYEGWGKDA